MTESNLRNPVLINTIGHAAGLLVFGFVIWLLFRDRRAHGVHKTGLSMLAAWLAFGWNAGSLFALGTSDPDPAYIQFIAALSFAVLSLLPAVLLQVALQGKAKALTVSGYCISGVAVLLHVAEPFVTSTAPHQAALLLVAAGFALLTLLAVVTSSRQRSEWISLACLFLFASSFPHFGYQHFQSPWAAEIAWHHIGIPVVLVVLLRDYRFLLLDTFIRFLMNSGLAAAYLACLLVIGRRFQLSALIASSMFAAGIALVMLCLSLIVFAHVRNVLQNWIGRAIFQRQNLTERIRRLTQLSSKAQTEEDLISGSAREVAAHFRAERYAVVAEAKPAMEKPWVEARMPLRFSSGEMRFLLAGTRRGRQRYLSEDLEDMRRLADVVVEQVERFRSAELRRLATQAELRALQAQINPHFLFNAFNTLYGTIDRESFEARQLVLNLTDIFRYFLQGDRLEIALSEELRIIKAYLEIEALRLGDRLETELNIEEAALPLTIPVLSVQPLVENAVKHGVASKLGKGRVVVRAVLQNKSLRITIQDSSQGKSGSAPVAQGGTGVGLANVRRRLDLSYGSSSTLTVVHGSEGCTVTLVIPVIPLTSDSSPLVSAFSSPGLND